MMDLPSRRQAAADFGLHFVMLPLTYSHRERIGTLVFPGMHQKLEGAGLMPFQSGQESVELLVSLVIVYEQQVELQFLGQGQRLPSAPRGSSTVAFAFQHALQRNEDLFIVIHNQYFDRITCHIPNPEDSQRVGGAIKHP